MHNLTDQMTLYELTQFPLLGKCRIEGRVYNNKNNDKGAIKKADRQASDTCTRVPKNIFKIRVKDLHWRPIPPRSFVSIFSPAPCFCPSSLVYTAYLLPIYTHRPRTQSEYSLQGRQLLQNTLDSINSSASERYMCCYCLIRQCSLRRLACQSTKLANINYRSTI